MKHEDDDNADRLILLLRHGIAEEPAAGKADRDRALTEEGVERMNAISRGLLELFPDVDRLISSPFLRCVQTSTSVVRAYGEALELETDPRLASGGDPEQVLHVIRSVAARRLLIVGHEPMLSETVRMVTRMQGSLELKRAGCIVLRQSGGSFELQALLPPRVLRRLGRCSE